MSTTLNGWTALDNPPVTRASPNGRLQGFANTDVADILAYLMWNWHTRVETVTQWGGHRKPAHNEGLTNAATRSNHLSATATDTNWDKHPFVRNTRSWRTFTSPQKAVLFQINDELGGVIRWGAIFSDEMHAELGPWVSAADAERAAAKARSRFVPPRTEDDVKDWQRIVGVTPDGLAGPGTVKATRAMQDKLGVPQTGLLDETTKQALSPKPAPISQSARAPKGIRANASTRDKAPVLTTVWQERLVSAGRLKAKDVDGDFGPKTETATKEHQRALGLTPDGRLGPDTVRADLALIGTVRRGDRGSGARWVQYVVGVTPDGVFGADTETATKAVQSYAGITPDGVAGRDFRTKCIVSA